MEVSQLIQQKLNELGLEQRDLADAAEVTESYISQLLSRKKMPPAPERTDIYDKLGRLLKLPAGKLAEPVGPGRWARFDRLVSQVTAHVLGKIAGIWIAARGILIDRLHDNPVEFAAQ